MEKYTMFMDQKNQYSENEYTTQSNLQIQCNPYQFLNILSQTTETVAEWHFQATSTNTTKPVI